MIDKIGLALLGGGALLILGIGFFIRFVPPEGVTTYAFVLGGRGLVDVALGLGTFVVGSIGVYFLVRRAKHDDRTIELSQFREAVNFLADTSFAANISGMFMLTRLAEQSPKDFKLIAATTLAGYVVDQSAEEWRAINELRQLKPVPPISIKRSGARLRRALFELSNLRLPGERGWPSPTGKLAINSFVVGEFTLTGLNYADVKFDNVYAKQLRFVECDLREASLRIFCQTHVVFENCDLRGAKITSSDIRNKRRNQIETINCLVTGCECHEKSVGQTGLY